MNTVRKLGLVAAAVAASALSLAGVASAEPVTVPFQIDPASFGNPNGSLDVPPMHCAAVVGDQPGTTRITGGDPGGWGCPLSSTIQWVNLSTGATGAGQLSDGLNGIPAQTSLHTGPGQVALMLNTVGGGVVTPGFATFSVP